MNADIALAPWGETRIEGDDMSKPERLPTPWWWIVQLLAAVVVALATSVTLALTEKSRDRFRAWLDARGRHPWAELTMKQYLAGASSDRTQESTAAAYRKPKRVRNAIAYLSAKVRNRPVIQKFPAEEWAPQDLRLFTVRSFVTVLRARNPELARSVDEAFQPWAQSAAAKSGDLPYGSIDLHSARIDIEHARNTSDAQESDTTV